ncbi:MAG: hypothetical protein H6752_00455 [Candidatus Omnitrophica bacterium]|nr:hypothetical protein [Candidatus Omnitrophota bacterium]
MIEKSDVATKITEFLHDEMTFGELVDWCEKQMLHGEFGEADATVTRRLVARIGLSDANAFVLTWQDCEEMLSELGYSVEMKLVPMG